VNRYYFDASALVKRYAKESGTPEVIRLLQQATNAYTASVAYAEVIMSLRRKQEGKLQAIQFTNLVHDLDVDWQELDRVELTQSVLYLVTSLTT